MRSSLSCPFVCPSQPYISKSTERFVLKFGTHVELNVPLLIYYFVLSQKSLSNYNFHKIPGQVIYDKKNYAIFRRNHQEVTNKEGGAKTSEILRFFRKNARYTYIMFNK